MTLQQQQQQQHVQPSNVIQVTCPLLGDASPTNIFRNLDLPDPAGPVNATNLP